MMLKIEGCNNIRVSWSAFTQEEWLPGEADAVVIQATGTPALAGEYGLF